MYSLVALHSHFPLQSSIPAAATLSSGEDGGENLTSNDAPAVVVPVASNASSEDADGGVILSFTPGKLFLLTHLNRPPPEVRVLPHTTHAFT